MKPVQQTGEMEVSSLAHWLEGDEFAEIDRHFARFLARRGATANAEVMLAAALASRSQRQGNIRLDLRTVAGTIFPGRAGPADSRIELPALETWMSALRQAPVVGRPGEFKPLVLDEHGRLYLHRYWEYESHLAQAILRRAAQVAEGVNESLLEAGLEKLFPTTPPTGDTDWQRVAAATAVRRQLCVISGGPGTGKTHTVAGLLALLLEQAGDRPLRIALAAPTGKAAARLQESLEKWKTTLPGNAALKARLPEESFTLHRLLGVLPDSAQVKYHAKNPLPFEVVVVDEASMVDLALMAKLFAATPPSTRLILLGDKDQLASVEAGAVLGDLCAKVGRASRLPMPPPIPKTPEDASGAGSPQSRRNACPALPLSQCIVELRKNYRFAADSGVFALGAAINDGDADRVVELLRGPGIGSALPAPGQLKSRLRERIVAGFRGVLEARDPVSALRAWYRFRILSPLRQGPYGVEPLNRLAEEILREAGLLSARAPWYAGRPVLVTRNDPALRLFNGDVGILLPHPASGELRGWFLNDDGAARSVLPLRLPEHETAFAMTVHKSQGSEFEQVLLMLPDRDSPVLTRELLYTGVTRASRQIEVWFEEAVLRASLARQVERTSGLREALWGAADKH
jgi:exodeoxyribonuclease V alpha subunit